MLPFILGGIALAATGYGVKKYFEDDTYTYNPYITFDCVNEIKDRLHATLFVETQWLYKSIKNLQISQPHLEAIYGKPYIDDTEENRAKLDEFCQILTAAQERQYKLLNELETVFCGVDDMEQLNDDAIAKALQMRELDTLMREACQVAITLDGVSISKMANITFGRLLSIV